MIKAKKYLEDKKTVKYVYTDYITPVPLKSGGFMVGGPVKDGLTYTPEDVEKALKIAYLEGQAKAFDDAALGGYDYDREMWEHYRDEALNEIKEL